VGLRLAVILREEHRLRVYENRKMRKFGGSGRNLEKTA
jgi:hypothetical protein